LEKEKKPIKFATKATGSIAVRIKGDKAIQHGRHFDDKDKIYSSVSRKSIDCLKEYFRDEMNDEWWNLMRDLKKKFEIL